MGWQIWVLIFLGVLCVLASGGGDDGDEISG